MLLAGSMWLKAEEQFRVVTSDSELSSGDVIVIGSSSAKCYAGPMGTKSYLTVVNSQADAIRFTLGGGPDSWTLSSYEGTLGAKNSKTLSTAGGTTTWYISIEGGKADIASTDDAFGSIQYNSNSPRFTCYTSTQSPIQIYKIRHITPPTDTSIGYIYNSDGTATVTGGAEIW